MPHFTHPSHYLFSSNFEIICSVQYKTSNKPQKLPKLPRFTVYIYNLHVLYIMSTYSIVSEYVSMLHYCLLQTRIMDYSLGWQLQAMAEALWVIQKLCWKSAVGGGGAMERIGAKPQNVFFLLCINNMAKNNARTFSEKKILLKVLVDMFKVLIAHCSLRCMQLHAHVQAHTWVSLYVQFITCTKS